jgi:membrane-associated phospholipid phosphatase
MRIHLDAELQIPLVPAFTIIYMSIYVLLFAVPFVLRVRQEITTLAATQTFIVFFAGICFLAIPAKLAFRSATDSDLGMWKPLFQFADKLNLDFNLVPSLHVALSIVCIEMFASHIGIVGKILLRSWGILIAASTVLTHQHHLLDAVTGYLLALMTVGLTKRVTSKKAHAPLKLSTAPLRNST